MFTLKEPQSSCRVLRPNEKKKIFCLIRKGTHEFCEGERGQDDIMVKGGEIVAK